jgi:transposase
MFYVGIDIAKRSHESCIINELGKQMGANITLTNDFDSIDHLSSIFLKYNITKDNVIIGMEATGHYWLPVYSQLLVMDFDVKVINPIISDAYRNMQVRQTKTDKKDSFLIAQIMRFGEYNSTKLADEETFALRQLTRYGTVFKYFRILFVISFSAIPITKNRTNKPNITR